MPELGAHEHLDRRTATFPSDSPYELDTEQMAQLKRVQGEAAGAARDARHGSFSRVADQVCAAVKENRFYVLTHPESVPVFAERAARIVAGENPIEPPQ